MTDDWELETLVIDETHGKLLAAKKNGGWWMANDRA
jgi:hypothetical protein